MATAFDNLFPVFGLIFVGHLLRRTRFTDGVFLRTSDRLVYYIFFPAMLFWKIGGAPLDLSGEAPLVAAAAAAVTAVFLLSTGYILLFRVERFQAGSFSQSCYRFNTFVGMAVVLSAFGEEGVRRFGLLIGLIIPLINVLAVGTLNWFGDRRVSLTAMATHTLRTLVANPLVLGCIGGLVYGRTVHHFPAFLDNLLRLASAVTLPLALLSIGGVLSVAGLRSHVRLSLTACGFKLVALPLVGFAALKLAGVSGPAYQVAMVFFALPTSTALYILSSQLNSDTELASSAIALSTVLSIGSLTVALLL
jgi:malonate transporter